MRTRDLFVTFDVARMSDAEVARLNRDIEELAADPGWMDHEPEKLEGVKLPLDRDDAERVLVRRIGGLRNLRSYVDSLMVYGRE